jgi:hypothetical protein
VIYLAIYLSVGIGVVVGFSMSQRISEEANPVGFVWLRDPDYNLEFFIMDCLRVIIWPIEVCGRTVALLFDGCGQAIDDDAPFAVGRRDLLEQLSISEIESREVVTDPLGAVPDRPFGHLHPAWKKFVEGVRPTDTLWSFSANWKTRWGCEELRAGYVIVRDGSIGPYVLTKYKWIPEDVRPMPSPITKLSNWFNLDDLF